MGKNPEPRFEEIEFVFSRLAKGMPDNEISYELQDTSFPLREDKRYYRRMRRYFDAAKKVLEVESDPLLAEKQRGHEDYLLGLVQGLGPLSLTPRIEHYWNWEREESENWRRDEYEKNVLELPDTLDLECLRAHLDPGDSIFQYRLEWGNAVLQHRDAGHELYVSMVDQAKELGIPFRTHWNSPFSMLVPEFVDSLANAAANMVGSYTGHRQPQYHTEQCEGDTDFQRLFFHGRHIATGTDVEVKRIEELHRRMLSEITEENLKIIKIREARDRYGRFSKLLSDAIQLKVSQRSFEKGPCKVCKIWGGLFGY